MNCVFILQPPYGLVKTVSPIAIGRLSRSKSIQESLNEIFGIELFEMVDNGDALWNG